VWTVSGASLRKHLPADVVNDFFSTLEALSTPAQQQQQQEQEQAENSGEN
jgi:hypothetical protein